MRILSRRDRVWLTRDDDDALFCKRWWQARAKQRCEMHADFVDAGFNRLVEYALEYVRTTQPYAQRGEHPHVLVNAPNDEKAAAMLVASLTIWPPRYP